MIDNIEQHIKEHLSNTVFHTVGDVADEMGRECYVVGGYVRDILLDRPSKDIDFVTVGSGIEVAEKVAKKLGPRTSVPSSTIGLRLFLVYDSLRAPTNSSSKPCDLTCAVP